MPVVGHSGRYSFRFPAQVFWGSRTVCDEARLAFQCLRFPIDFVDQVRGTMNASVPFTLIIVEYKQ